MKRAKIGAFCGRKPQSQNRLLQYVQLAEMALQPKAGGVFVLWNDDELVWVSKRDGGVPGPKQLKQRTRDKIKPQNEILAF